MPDELLVSGEGKDVKYLRRKKEDKMSRICSIDGKGSTSMEIFKTQLVYTSLYILKAQNFEFSKAPGRDATYKLCVKFGFLLPKKKKRKKKNQCFQ